MCTLPCCGFEFCWLPISCPPCCSKVSLKFALISALLSYCCSLKCLTLFPSPVKVSHFKIKFHLLCPQYDRSLHRITLLRGCEQEQPIFLKYSLLNLRYFSLIGSNLQKALSQLLVIKCQLISKNSILKVLQQRQFKDTCSFWVKPVTFIVSCMCISCSTQLLFSRPLEMVFLKRTWGKTLCIFLLVLQKTVVPSSSFCMWRNPLVPPPKSIERMNEPLNP